MSPHREPFKISDFMNSKILTRSWRSTDKIVTRIKWWCNNLDSSESSYQSFSNQKYHHRGMYDSLKSFRVRDGWSESWCEGSAQGKKDESVKPKTGLFRIQTETATQTDNEECCRSLLRKWSGTSKSYEGTRIEWSWNVRSTWTDHLQTCIGGFDVLSH